ncbi:MAG: 6-bladed beta-propeller [Tannerellaceae bacterium]|nr:6-bladed beta-propeller [Tannerellaceae bacterium]
MKKETTILTIILLMAAGLSGCKHSAATIEDKLVTIDVTAHHPEKELILQDFMDVEYIPLETNDEFITQGGVMAIGNQYIVVINWNNDGNIFLFDRHTGKGIRKINRKGQGAEEYSYINGIVLDEDSNELFVNSTSSKKIFVYDLAGNFKRSLVYEEGTEYLNIFNCDKNNLIGYDTSGTYKDGENKGDKSFHALISKQDGSITDKILIPFDVIKAPVVKEGEGVAVGLIPNILPSRDNFFLVETSSDTIYKYVSKEKKLSPFIVKTPTEHPVIFLTMGVVTDRYYFMETTKRVFDFEKRRGFPTSDLMYDKEENKVYDPTVLNDDFVKKQTVVMTSKTFNGEIAACQNLAAHSLVEAYENNELKGKLKEVAAGLDEESNPVIMLMKYKN